MELWCLAGASALCLQVYLEGGLTGCSSSSHSCSPADHCEPEARTELQRKKKRRKRKRESQQEEEESKHPEGQRSPRPSVTPVPELSVNGHLSSDRLGEDSC